MSLIVCTQTQITCDHFVNSHTLPAISSIDVHHMKMFLSPNEDFIFALTGVFTPEKISSAESMAAVTTLLDHLEKVYAEKLDIPDSDPVVLKLLNKILPDPETEIKATGLVTKTAGWSMRHHDKECIVSHRDDGFCLGDHASMATSMVKMGVETSDVFYRINRYSPLVSREHTSWDLSMLKDRS